ncbi:MAG: tRNA dihydrouridine synthase, partial [Bacteroidia bacterium]
IQIFGGDEEAMAMSARIVDATNPDILDINFGCPVKKVVCQGAGAGVLKDIDLMVRLTKAVVNSTKLPVTVKTRLGWDEKSINIMEVAERLQDVGIKALSIHGRTRAQMYKGQADWSWIAKVKENPRIQIPIFGNGDVDSPEKAKLMRDTYGIDGIMIGRASIGHPWIFNEIKHFMKTGEHLPPPTIEDRVLVCRTHLEKSVAWKGERLGLIEMRRHYANYFKGMPNFKEYRTKFVMEENLGVVYATLDEIVDKYSALKTV